MAPGAGAAGVPATSAKTGNGSQPVSNPVKISCLNILRFIFDFIFVLKESELLLFILWDINMFSKYKVSIQYTLFFRLLEGFVFAPLLGFVGQILKGRAVIDSTALVG